uniref:Uncharacterized protein n=1 Tax=Lygus hesperus TaxID=30085 RepID=A0A146L078_LYGHE
MVCDCSSGSALRSDTDNSDQKTFEFSTTVVHDPLFQWCPVQVCVLFFDVSQIDLRSADDDTDQSAIVGSHTGHAFFELFREEPPLVLDALDYGEVPSFGGSRGFALDGLFDVPSGQLFVLLADGSQVGVGAGDEDFVESRLFSAPLSFTCVDQFLRIRCCSFLIDISRLITVRRTQSDHQLSEAARGISLNIFIHIAVKLLFVSLGDGFDSIIAQRTQDFSQCIFIGSHTVQSFLHLASIEVGEGRHQSHDCTFEIASQFAFQGVDQILAVHGFVLVNELKTLLDRSLGDDVYDGLFVSSESLHGGLECLAVGIRVEVFVGEDSSARLSWVVAAHVGV